ncbi:MAG: ribosomal protein L13e [Candidatus Bathyarchaeia archaeon]|nr:ribosomal protein L13e [Candidatus Bathyarchaeota archaeon]
MIEAIVYGKRGRRCGKGFSREELKAVGLSVVEALSLKIPVDIRRKTRHDENIEALKRHLNQASENLKA